jgi:RimJ/RimL family protein N-acetyltransferase
MPQIWIQHPTNLHGHIVDLLPLEEEHFDELLEAASDKRIWEFYVGDWSIPEKFNRIYTASLNLREQGLEYPFVVYHKPTKKIIGSTRFLDIGRYDRRLEIGGTWYIPQHWGTAVNFDCKLIMLTHCFEALGVHRVQLKTQQDNIRSRKAIEKIGGIYEGILREHMFKDDGSYRSSAYFSILQQEWDTVKLNLQSKLATLIP